MVLEGVNDGTFLRHTLTVKSPPITTKKLIEALLCRLQPDLSLTERVVLSARANAHVPRISLSVSLFHDYFLPDLIGNILAQIFPRSFTKQEMLSASFLMPPFLNAGNPLVSLCFIYYIQCGVCRAGARGKAARSRSSYVAPPHPRLLLHRLPDHVLMTFCTAPLLQALLQMELRMKR